MLQVDCSFICVSLYDIAAGLFLRQLQLALKRPIFLYSYRIETTQSVDWFQYDGIGAILDRIRTYENICTIPQILFPILSEFKRIK